MTTLRTSNSRLRRSGWLRSATTAFSRLSHRIAHRACHRIAHCETGAESYARPRAAALILRRIAHRVGSLELRVTTDIADDTHRRAFVHRRFDFLRQRDVLDQELRQLQTKRLELFVQLLTGQCGEFVVV